MLWGTSSLALYIPWAGKSGPYLGLSLWLWLGVLDAVQGVGLGMILLQTLSRLHVCATLAFAQVIGSICVMVARATAPNRIGPGTVFPDIATWDFQANGLKGSPMANAPFWIALICQLIIVVGYFWFYRKEQLGAFISDYHPIATIDENVSPQPDHDLRSLIYVTYTTSGLLSIPWACFRSLSVFLFDLKSFIKRTMYSSLVLLPLTIPYTSTPS